ncbi:hypothetical protein ASE12_16845 [Aeromicrobium sp. Root236]|uniref:hypothetical protein n=1 Tax=Aeromicrobium sp. Root236 TaxID=1736498 RepID=UPI0006F5AC0D|nr:hypothetical protein [Aeromicrobium sp. Root236]KRC66278.1 hypothetical protein ASE12_16845 [Aeromicrobium sp. Root236]
MNVPVALASVVLLAGTLTACGGGDGGGSGGSGDYCKELKRSTSALSGVGAAPGTDWAENFKDIHDLADKAPDEIAGDWKTVDQAFTQLEKGLKDAGLKPSDMTKIGSGDTSGLDPDAMEKIVKEFMKIGSEKVSNAFEAVAKHAKDECKVDLDVG